MKLYPYLSLAVLLLTSLSCNALSGPGVDNAPTAAETFPPTARLGNGLAVAAALSPDGQVLVVAATTGLIFYHAQTWEKLQALETGWVPAQVAFSPDGRFLAAGGDTTQLDEHPVQIWLFTLNNGQPQLTPLQTLSVANYLHEIAFSADGETLAVADCRVNLWQVSDGKPIQTLSGGPFACYTDLTFSPDGQWLAAAGTPGSEKSTPTRLWALSDLDHPNDILQSVDAGAVAFSPDSQTLLVGNSLRQVSDGTSLRTFDPFSANRAVFLPDGKRVLVQVNTAGLAGQVLALDTVTGAQVELIPPQRTPQLAVAPDGQLLALVGETRVDLWAVDNLPSASPQTSLGGFSTQIWQVTFTPDGQHLLTDEHGQVTLWEFSGSAQTFGEYEADPISTYALSADGSRLALGRAGSVQLWQLSDRSLLHTLITDGQYPPRLVFSPDGQWLAGATETGLQLWQVSDGAPIKTLAGLTNYPLKVAFSPDGRWLATDQAGDSLTVGVWEVETGALQYQLQGRAVISQVVFSPDGQYLATAGDHAQDLEISLWNLSDGSLARRLSGHRLQIKSLAFSPDGSLLASGEGDYAHSPTAVRVWRVSDGQLLQTLAGHPNLVTSLAFAPDNQRLYAPSDDRVYVWDLAGGTLVYQSESQPGGISSLAISPDGTQLTTSSPAGTVYLWAVP